MIQNNRNYILQLFYSIVIIFSAQFLHAQKVIAGPMLGYNTMREAAIWVQTDQEAELYLAIQTSDLPVKLFQSQPVKTEQLKANTATLITPLLEPGTTYSVQVMSNEQALSEKIIFTTQPLWQWRKPAPDFSFLAGSCLYINETQYDRPGTPYGNNYEILEKMATEDTDFMVWLGDNNYLREVDWNSRQGIYHRYSHSRGLPELQSLLKKMHHYAIWDDHDYGPNDSDWTYWNKDITREAFTDFWANPNYGVTGLKGTTGTFSWNDCQFFLLDNRWDRTPEQSDGSILGEAQTKWLIDALRYSQASFKFICIGGQFLSDFQGFENHANYSQERQYILDQLDKYQIKGVIFLNGDRHHSEISRMETKAGQVYYDITTSPLTSGSYDHSSEPNHFRVPETIIDVRSYAEIKVYGAIDRKCQVLFKGVDGKVLVDHLLDFGE